MNITSKAHHLIDPKQIEGALAKAPERPFGIFLLYKIAQLAKIDTSTIKEFKEAQETYGKNVQEWLNENFPSLGPQIGQTKEIKDLIFDFKYISKRRVKALYANKAIFETHQDQINQHFDKKSVSKYLSGTEIMPQSIQKQLQTAKNNEESLKKVELKLHPKVQGNFKSKFAHFYSGKKALSQEIKDKLLSYAHSFENGQILSSESTLPALQKAVYYEISASLVDDKINKDQFEENLINTTKETQINLEKNAERQYKEITNKINKINSIKDFISEIKPEYQVYTNLLCNTTDIITQSKDGRNMIDLAKSSLNIQYFSEINSQLDSRINNITNLLTENHFKTIEEIASIKTILIESNYTEETVQNVISGLTKELVNQTDNKKLIKFNNKLENFKNHLNTNSTLQAKLKSIEENITYAKTLDSTSTSLRKDGTEISVTEYLIELEKVKGEYVSEIKRFDVGIQAMAKLLITRISLEKKPITQQPIPEQSSSKDRTLFTDFLTKSLSFLEDTTNYFKSLNAPEPITTTQSTTEKTTELPIINLIANNYLKKTIDSQSTTHPLEVYNSIKENIEKYNNLITEAESLKIKPDSYKKININDINEIDILSEKINDISTIIKDHKNSIKFEELKKEYNQLYQKLIKRYNSPTDNLDTVIKRIHTANPTIAESISLLQSEITILKSTKSEIKQAQAINKLIAAEKNRYDQKLQEFQEAGFQGKAFEEVTDKIIGIDNIKTKITESVNEIDRLLKELKTQESKRNELFIKLESLYKEDIIDKTTFESFNSFEFIKNNHKKEQLEQETHRTNEEFLNDITKNNAELEVVIKAAEAVKEKQSTLYSLKETISFAATSAKDIGTNISSKVDSWTAPTVQSEPTKAPSSVAGREERKSRFKELKQGYDEAINRAKEAKLTNTYEDFKTVSKKSRNSKNKINLENLEINVYKIINEINRTLSNRAQDNAVK